MNIEQNQEKGEFIRLLREKALQGERTARTKEARISGIIKYSRSLTIPDLTFILLALLALTGSSLHVLILNFAQKQRRT